MYDLKKSEIRGYHAFAEKSGRDGSYKGFFEYVRNGRESPYFNFLLDIMRQKGGKVLDFAAGTCWTSYILSEKGYSVVALEMNPSDLCGLGVFKKHRDNMPFQAVQGDCENSPLKEGVFDVVFCHQALHHASDLDRMVAEMTRAAKKGGLIIAGGEHIRPFFTSDEEFRKKHQAVIFGANEHAYPYYRYRDAFKQAGLAKVNVIPRGFECDFKTISQKPVRALIKGICRIPFIGERIVRFILLNFSGAGTEVTIYGFKS